VGVNRTITISILVAVTVALIGWDIYVAVVETPATISVIVLGWAQAHPVLPFAIGVVCGHLLWPQVVRRQT
jgi:hypothetical protein